MVSLVKGLHTASRSNFFYHFRIRLKQCHVLSSYQYESTSASSVSEIKIPVPYGHIAAKAWGSANGIPVLALHGWLDNCGTFDNLIPQLPHSHYYVALDLPGHGFSSHRPQGCFYTYFDMITDVKRVVNHFSWDKFNILGHSMGGEIALLWTGIYPTTVDKLILLDVVKPFSEPLSKLVKCAQSSIDGNLDIEAKLTQPPPVYTHDNALKRLVAGMYNEITQDSASILLLRGTKPSPDKKGLIFTRDLRIRTIEPFNVLSHEGAKAFVSNIACSMLILLAKNSGPTFKSPYLDEEKLFIDIYKENCKKLTVESIDGNHFMHLNEPMKVSPLITSFLK